MWKALKYIIIFFAIQILCALVPTLFFRGTREMIMPIMVASSLLFILYIVADRKKAGISRESFRAVSPRRILLLGVGAVLFFLLPEIKLVELLDLPNDIEQLEPELGTPLGLLAAGILGPVAEELLMRGAVLGALLSWRPLQGKPMLAVVLSAALFSLIHMNPAQMPGSFMMGVLLGWLCYRTGSLIPGIVMHVFNNSFACIAEMADSGEDSVETLSEWFGSPVLEGLVLSVSLLMLFVIVRALIRLVDRHYPARPLEPAPVEGEA